jgi:hypothetical protein
VSLPEIEEQGRIILRLVRRHVLGNRLVIEAELVGPRAPCVVVAGRALVIPTRHASREREQCCHCHNVPHSYTLSASPDIVKTATLHSWGLLHGPFE